ncbi:MAG: MFS transporter, partial [Clostridiales bacterium]|nr:MFS transporter [Clostridiales bacterium]
HESLNRTKQKIDYAGAFVIVTGIVCLMLALELGGKTFEWLSFAIIGLFAAALMLLSAFILIEFKAAEPIIPMSLFKSRLFTSSQGVGFFYGFVMITASVYIPIFIQGVNGGTATNSGLILLPMTIGSVAGSQFGGLFSQKASYRRMMLYSIAIALSGFILLSTLTPATVGWLISVFMLISGFGLGISYSILSMSAIHDIDIRQRGTANSCSSFFRTFGMTLGVTICGTVQNNFMQKRFLENIPQYSTFNTPIEARALLQPQVRMNIPKDILSKMTDILASSITSVFLLCLIPLAISLVLILLMGKSRLDMSGKSKSTPQTDIKSSQATD